MARMVPKNRPAVSRPLGGSARYSTEPEFRSETTEQARRRRQRSRREEIEERAHFLLENDPDINSLAEARKVARQQEAEIEEFAAQTKKGLVDPSTGEPTREGRKRVSTNGRHPTSRSRTAKKRSSRPNRRAPRAVRQTARTVVAPFESTASAGWTFFQGGLSLVLLFVILRSGGAIGDFTNGITAGFKRFADPTVPLIPTAGESAPPPPTRRTVRQQL